MEPMNCFQCKNPVEPPFTKGMRWSVWDTRFEKIICEECWDAIEQELAGAKEIEQGIRAGSICAYCDEPLDTPGGTTIESPDHKLRRVHAKCKAEIERLRGKA